MPGKTPDDTNHVLFKDKEAIERYYRNKDG